MTKVRIRQSGVMYMPYTTRDGRQIVVKCIVHEADPDVGVLQPYITEFSIVDDEALAKGEEVYILDAIEVAILKRKRGLK